MSWCSQFGTSLADSRAWQAYMPDATADNTSLLNQAHVQYLGGTRGSTVEKPAETQTSIQLASHLVRVPNSWSGGHEFESNSWSGGHEFESSAFKEIGALTKSGKTLGVRSSCSGDPNVIRSCVTCVAHILSGCVIAVCHVLAESLAWRHSGQYFSTKPSPCAVPTWYWRKNCREAC